MTIASMTGFARREISGAFGTLVCEIRSVNHRFLDLSLRLPDSCRALEADLRAALAAQLRRGKVDCTLSQRSGAGEGQAALQTNDELLQQLQSQLQRMGKSIALPTQVNLLDLLRWPGVLREDPGLAEQLPAAARTLLMDTVGELARARAREGERLAELIATRCNGLEAMVSAIRARLPEIHARVRSRLQERLAELGAQVNQDRVEQELVMLLQRLDVAEELDRLVGHIAETRRTLKAPEAAGRRLDFLLQEFNREANTLSSKSQDLETTRTAVEMKVLIEQMREQVQNIE